MFSFRSCVIWYNFFAPVPTANNPFSCIISATVFTEILYPLSFNIACTLPAPKIWLFSWRERYPCCFLRTQWYGGTAAVIWSGTACYRGLFYRAGVKQKADLQSRSAEKSLTGECFKPNTQSGAGPCRTSDLHALWHYYCFGWLYRFDISISKNTDSNIY